MDKDYIKSVESGKLMVGKNSLLKHLKGQRITKQQAINAKCYDCNGLGEQRECDIKICPLYGYTKCTKISTGPDSSH